MAFTYGTINKCTTADGTMPNVYEVRLGYELVELGKPEDNPSVSTIKLQLEVRSTDSRYKPYGYTQTTTIDGTSLGTKTFDLRSTNTWQVFGTRTITVNHNADGTYSASKSGSFTASVTGPRPKSGTASVPVTLPTIPKASSITVSDANIGSATNIVINKASDSFTTYLYYLPDGQSGNPIYIDATNNQVYGWTVPTSLYNLIPNQKTIGCTFYADTYSGSTLVGTKTARATFTATGNPIINNYSLVDTNSTTVALTGDNTKMVRYASNVVATITATPQNSATISSIQINGVTASNGSVTFNGASSNSFQGIVTDSRGYQSVENKTMNMVDYVPLTINATIKRNQPTDGIVNINLSGNYFNDSFGVVSNTLTVEYRYKVSGASSWDQDWTSSGVTVTKSGNTYTATKDLSGMTYTNSYQFEVRATDQVGTQTITGITVTKGQPVYWWDDDGVYVTGLLKKGGSNVATASDIGNATLIIQKNGSTVASFGANASSNATANITVPTNTNELTNGAGFVALGDVVSEGNNTNGNWIKFGSGLMICYYDSGSTEVTVSGNAITTYTYTFPTAFISAPFVMTQMNSNSTSPDLGYVSHSALNITTTTFDFRWFSRTTQRSPRWGYLAIGRWK